MTTRKDDLESRWETLPADDDRLKKLTEYVSLESIEKATNDRLLLCRDCEEVVFFEADHEVWNTKQSHGIMRLPAGISATIYKGYYSIN